MRVSAKFSVEPPILSKVYVIFSLARVLSSVKVILWINVPLIYHINLTSFAFSAP